MTSAPSSSQHERDFALEPKSVPSNMDWPEPDPIKNWPIPPSNIPETKKRPIVGRISRAIVRYSILFLIAIGATLAWQSYSDEAIKIVRTEVPSLASLLPVSTAKPPPDGQASAVAVAPSGDLVQQLRSMAVDLESMAVNLAIVRRSQEQLTIKMEQLAAKQDQMAQNIATFQSVEQEVIQKLSSPPQPRASPAPKPPQPTGQSSATQSPSLARPTPPAGQPLR
jgi:hypothetical protein